MKLISTTIAFVLSATVFVELTRGWNRFNQFNISNDFPTQSFTAYTKGRFQKFGNRIGILQGRRSTVPPAAKIQVQSGTNGIHPDDEILEDLKNFYTQRKSIFTGQLR